MGYFKKYWRGEKPLWKAFWLWGVLLGVTINVIVSIAVVNLYLTTELLLLINLIYYIYYFPYWIWIFVSIWRCAANSFIVFALLAKLIVILGWIGVFFAFIGIFTQDYGYSANQLFKEELLQMQKKTKENKIDNKIILNKEQSEDRKPKPTLETIYIEDLVPNEDGMIEIPRNANLISREEE